jgi:hypothetical protein
MAKEDNIDEYSRKEKIIIHYRNVSLYSYEKLLFFVLFLKDAILTSNMEMEYYLIMNAAMKNDLIDS